MLTIFAILLLLLTPAIGVSQDATPGIVHFEDGRTLRFDDLLKFRFGSHPGQILLEPRGVYVQAGASAVQVPARELAEISVTAYRAAAAENCARPCGIAKVELAVQTANGMNATATAGFADSFVVVVRADRWSEPESRVIPWARIARDGMTALNVRRITFATP
jgi:hypothetical protein